MPRSPALRFRLLLDSDHALGPGKADLLETIAATGSITAAGRGMRMSYKRAWQLADELNRSFASPLIVTNKGGKRGGGAVLTPTGEQVLAVYRAIEAKAQKAFAAEMRILARLLAEKE
ncbi:MAG: LysR family transcriptional regulator [Rudaea sp.]|uniref:winged helix-turn-helix domain-containing protein n=1 Tax=unclassified Rudaea TaxID=2627037 RepID=UPI0010FA3421|nr:MULTISPECIES: LysR family transcriptional regulator [unclassified Rudaea]MBN8887406.1 LysR family transcriptional regulator [Rudaea sp.]MBR0344932.1 LysR family transcriptional regulator [Rudaea sp.]